jgi:FkbM family methyltransferase
MFAIFRVLKKITSHPLNRNRRVAAALNFIRWQIVTRLFPARYIKEFVNDSRLIMVPGMTAATGNLYCGLFEFEEMAFVIHYTRESDFFVDIGANIGVYSVLAGKVCGAEGLSIEPIPATCTHLLDNLKINDIDSKFALVNVGLAGEVGSICFTSTLDSTNHALRPEEAIEQENTIEVVVDTLDRLCEKYQFPTVLKIDVEGFEAEVLKGASETLEHPELNIIIIELRGHGDLYNFSESEIHELLIKHGFKSYEYSPFDRALAVDDSEEFEPGDKIYIRDAELAASRVEASPDARLPWVSV